jgi:hypothetical protein
MLFRGKRFFQNFNFEKAALNLTGRNFEHTPVLVLFPFTRAPHPVRLRLVAEGHGGNSR